MTANPHREHDHLRVMIEQMQRADHPQNAIHEAVRQALGRTTGTAQRPVRSPGRFGLFGRLRRP